MSIDDEQPAGTPEWMVTYSDMMSLLLTFFILLVSLSEIKKNDRFQGIADSIQYHFGSENARTSSVPGESRPRNSELAALAVSGRIKRMNLLGLAGRGDRDWGRSSVAQNNRPKEQTTAATTIAFAEGSVELGKADQETLRAAAQSWQSKPTIEIRGRLSRSQASQSQESLDLAYERCRQTYAFLLNGLRIDPARLRVTVEPSYEPLETNSNLPFPDGFVEVVVLEDTSDSS